MKKVLTLALAGVMAVSLVACGSDAPATTGSTGDAKTPGTTYEAKPCTLNVTTTFAGQEANVDNYQKAIADWQAATGNKVLDASATADEEFKTGILNDFETGAEPDVLFFFNGVDSNRFVEQGKVVSVDEIRQEFPEYASNMKDSMLGASPVDGVNYSIPVYGYWEGMYVNKTVLEDCGVEVPGADTTWEDFLADCEKIKEKGYSPIAASLVGVPHYWFEFCIYNHQDVATHNVLPANSGDDRGKEWVAGLSDIKALYEAGYFPANTLTATDDETFQMFIDGKAAFLVDGSWKTGGIVGAVAADPENITEEEAAKLANFTVTYVPGMGNRKSTDIIGGLSSGYYITKKAWEDPDKRVAAVDFVQYMTSTEMVSLFAGTAATALKDGVQLDESTLNSLQIDGLAMTKGATGITPAVQDLVDAVAREPIFAGMANLVTQDEEGIAGLVDEVLTANAEANAQ